MWQKDRQTDRIPLAIAALEFNSRFTSLVKNGYISISIFHADIRSLNSNHRKLCKFLVSICVDFDIIILTEIWSSNISFYHNILPGYIFHYVLPPKGNVGGVGIFVNKAVESSDCLLYTSPSPRDRQKSRMPSSA